ncbi:uncharacterized protein LOC124457840 [Xenia sp. Carnegie-2017]|uniref:uncharacterized protein LOC124457840 n=1 Tax=Xenia sp. Carnegie-2017 TaxID=2897299 RepID=UPI001F036D70|nr:uncharacterized protein LOC124457840 [Xenia sp. Carnegie-2017]
MINIIFYLEMAEKKHGMILKTNDRGGIKKKQIERSKKEKLQREQQTSKSKKKSNFYRCNKVGHAPEECPTKPRRGSRVAGEAPADGVVGIAQWRGCGGWRGQIVINIFTRESRRYP